MQKNVYVFFVLQFMNQHQIFLTFQSLLSSISGGQAANVTVVVLLFIVTLREVGKEVLIKILEWADT